MDAMKKRYACKVDTSASVAARYLVIALVAFGVAGCSALLPKQETIVEGPWQSFQEAQQTFDKIIPYKTTVQELQQLKLDPDSNPNVIILNYSDILRRFVPNTAIDGFELEKGVHDCILANAACKGYELEYKSITRKRYGNFWADFMNFRRKTNIVGWRFNGVILIKGNMVVYKLTSG
ncbi:MAG: hypothetical protein A3K04_07000, partial [Gallionellales bacterium RBG_16_56_9]